MPPAAPSLPPGTARQEATGRTRRSAHPPWWTSGAGWVPALSAVAGLLVGLATVGRSTLWRDEMATRQFSTLSLADLLHATDHVDRVLLPYYLAQHVWQLVAGSGAVALRMPSVLAGAATCALAAATARRAWGTVAGVVAGAALVLNGSFLAHSVDARPYAGVVMLTSLAFWAVTEATLREVTLREAAGTAPRRWPWVVYAVASTLAVVLHPFAVLGLVPVAVLVPRPLWRPWLAASALPLAATLAALAASGSQSGQLDWIHTPGVGSAWNVVVAGSGGSPAVWPLLVAVLLAAWAQRRARRSDRVWLAALALLLFPTLALLGASYVAWPVLVDRYVASVSLAAALLLGAGAAAAARLTGRTTTRAAVVTASVAVVVVGASSAAGLWTTYDATVRYGDAFGALAQSLGAQLRPGDVLAIRQEYYRGGVVAGIATYADDTDLAATVQAALRGDGEPTTYVRTVTAARPGSFSTTAAPAGPVTGRVWVVEEDRATPLTEQLVGAGCARDGTSRTFGTLHVAPLTCTAAEIA